MYPSRNIGAFFTIAHILIACMLSLNHIGLSIHYCPDVICYLSGVFPVLLSYAPPTRLYGGVIWPATCIAKADRTRRVLHFIGNLTYYRLDSSTSCLMLLMPASTNSKSGKMLQIRIGYEMAMKTTSYSPLFALLGGYREAGIFR
jgi:hypothetical protein